MRHRFKRLVSVTTPEADGSTDTYGNPTYADATTTEYKGWAVRQGTSENSINRETAKATWLVLLPPEAEGVVLNTSTVAFDSETCRVIGVPNPVYTGRGVHHVEVLVEQIEG
jgi:hypothetical protein